MSQSQQPTPFVSTPLATHAAAPLADPVTARRSLAPPPPKFSDTIADFIARGLVGDPFDHEAIPESKHLSEARRKCREGNPFPLVAMQWPELVVRDPAEAIYFDGAIGDKANPCLRLDVWQRNDILRPIFDDTISELVVKGNTKAGKGLGVSLAINLWFDVFMECKIILTSQRFDHAVDVIFGEVSAWRSKMQHPGNSKLLAHGIFATKQRYLTIANPQSGEGFSGQHGPRTLFVFDEATSIADGFYSDAQKQARKIVALANPRTLSGWFRDCYKPCGDINKTQTVDGPFGRRHCLTVSGLDCCNVRNCRLERPLAPVGGIDIELNGSTRHFTHNETIPPEYFAKVATLIPNQCDYGRFKGICQHPDPRHVDVFGYGKFPTEDTERQVILGSWLAFHESAWQPIPCGPKVECFGLDVAAFHDETILAVGGGGGVTELLAYRAAEANRQATTAEGVADLSRAHTMRVVGWVLATIEQRYGIRLQDARVPICVDSDGVGKGVGDRLIELGCWTLQFYGNASSQCNPRHYGNMRAEAYGELGRRLNPEMPWGGEPWAIPTDAMLREELTAPEKVYGSDPERFHLTPKRRRSGMSDRIASVQDKIGRSPDRADAVAYLFHAVRELGLWSSWELDASRQTTAMPVSDAEWQDIRGKVAKGIANPDSTEGQAMGQETRDLLKFFQQDSRGW